MTTLQDRPNTALIVLDAQRGVLEGAFDRHGVVANIVALVERARRSHTPVIWIQHADEHLVEGSEAWQYVPELVRRTREPLVHKHYGDAFEETTLETKLSAAHVGRLIVAGAQTDECIRSTIHGAFVRGYDVTLVADAHTTEDLSEWGAPTPELVIAHTNLYWGEHTAPGRTAAVVETAAVSFTD